MLIFRQILLWVVVWLIMTVVGACYAMRFQGSVDWIGRLTSQSAFKPVEYYDTLDHKVIRIVRIGDTSKTPMLLIHGSPSSLMEWQSLFEDTAFLNHYNLIGVDRPGYGLADYGNLEMDLHKQAHLLNRVILKSGIKRKAIVVGSSYGGSIAACYAMDYPTATQNLVLMYSSLKPGAEKIYPISKAVLYPVINQLTPTLLRMPTYEKFNHYALLKSLNRWDNITAPTLIIHGTADSLIYYENALFAQQSIRHAPVQLISLPGLRHALMFSKPKLMKQLLKNYLETK